MMRTPLVLLLLLITLPARAEMPLSDRAVRAFDCARVAPDAMAMLDCAAPLADGAALQAAMTCLLRGEGPVNCLGLREVGLLGTCLAAAGLSAEAAGGCVALRLATREASRCLSAGIGMPGGCFGPGNTLRQWGEAGMEAWRKRDAMLGWLPAF